MSRDLENGTRLLDLEGKRIKKIQYSARGALCFYGMDDKLLFRVRNDVSIFDSDGNYFDTDQVPRQKSPF